MVKYLFYKIYKIYISNIIDFPKRLYFLFIDNRTTANNKTNIISLIAINNFQKIEFL